MWKRKQNKLYDKPLKFPKWTIINILDTDEYYMIWNQSTKKKFISKRAYESWGRKALIVTKESIVNFKLFGQLGFRSGSVVEYFATGKKYYVMDDVLQEITTPDFFDVLGYNINDCIKVSLSEIDFHKMGDQIREVI